MAKLAGISENKTDFIEILHAIKTKINANLNCHNIGRILEFDPATQTCTVELMQVKQYMDKYYNPAPITDVPLIIYGAGGGHITLPDPVGTYCLLFFMDRNIDSFLETGEQYVPETTRMHDFTDCIAITTFKTLVNPIADYDDLAVSILNSKEFQENMQGDSYIKVYPQSINTEVKVTDSTNEDLSVTNSTNINQTSTQIRLTTSASSEITIDDKILIKNNSGDLMSLISALINAIKSIVTLPDVSGGGLNPDSIQALTEVETMFKGLLSTGAESEAEDV